MSGNATTLSIGGVTVSTTGAHTGALLDQIQSVLGTLSVVAPAVGDPLLPAPTVGGPFALVIPTGDTGIQSIPSGYQYVVYTGSGTVVGGDANTVIVGDLNANTGAGTVISAGDDPGTVVDTTAGALFSFAGGQNLVFGLGDTQKFLFDGGFSSLVANGAGDTVSIDGAASVIGYFNNAADFSQFGGSATLVAGVGVSTLDAVAGNTVFWGSAAGDSVMGGTGNTEFLNSTGTSTFIAGTGADTVFAQSSLLYQGGTGQSLFIGGSGMSTVHASSNEVAYGGTGGDVVYLAQGDTLLMVGGGGTDTIDGNSFGGTVAPTVWGNNNEMLTVISSVPGGLYAMFGNSDNLNLAASGGSSHILGINGAGFTGNTTLTASSAGNDSVVLFGGSQFGMAGSPHTITIANWQSSDVLDLTFASIGGQTFGYTEADAASAQTQLATASSFTLSDGTTVDFVGAKPTTVAHI